MTERDHPNDWIWDLAFEAMKVKPPGPPTMTTTTTDNGNGDSTTHCKRGHSREAEAYVDQHGRPHCRACQRDRYHRRQEAQASLETPTWQNATHANPVAIAAFVDQRLAGRNADVTLGGGGAKALRCWRMGSRRAPIDSVDRFLRKLDIHLAEVPDDVWHGQPTIAPTTTIDDNDLAEEQPEPGPTVIALTAPPCRCPRPLPGRDEDGDACCLHCGRRLDVALAHAA